MGGWRDDNGSGLFKDSFGKSLWAQQLLQRDLDRADVV
jgi:hypothetical protein